MKLRRPVPVTRGHVAGWRSRGATRGGVGLGGVGLGGFVLVGVLVALGLAAVGSHFASDRPDGLEAVTYAGCVVDASGAITGGECIARDARPSAAGSSPLAEYGVRGVDDPVLSRGVAGVVGVGVTLLLGYLLLRLLGGRSGAGHGR